MSATTAAVRGAIVARLGSVAGIGVVHAYERYAKTDAAFKAFYLTEIPAGTKVLRGWFVSRLGQRRRALRVGRAERIDRWKLVGLLGLIDDHQSELTASDLADAVVAAFAADPTLGGLVNGQDDGEDLTLGPQIEAIEPVLFAGTLCHRVTLSLITRRFE